MSKFIAKIDTKELERLADEIAKSSSETANNVHVAVGKFAFLIDREAKKKVQKGSRSGRVYRRKSIRHTASAPGEPPKTDTGRLVASIRPVLGPGFFRAEVGSLAKIAKYGGMLEEGTTRMEARPWLEPTLTENQSELNKMFTAAIKAGGLFS